MADPNLKVKPVQQGKKIVLALECKVSNDKWMIIGYLQPKAAISGQDTLNLDIFAPKIEWQDYIKKGRSIILTGNDGVARIKTGVFFHSQDILRVETRVTFSRPVRLEMAKDVLSLSDFNIDNSWTPHQTPLPEMVIGDMAFRSPVVMVQNTNNVLGIIPNLKTLKNNRTIPTAMTFSAQSNEISFGCVPYRLSANTYFAHDDSYTIDVPRSTVSYSYFIYFKNNCRKSEGYRNIIRRMWQLNFPTQSKKSSAQKTTFEKYTGYAFEHSLKKFRENKKIIPIHLALQTAFGMILSSKRKNEPIPDEVEKIIKTAISSPQENGLFKVMYKDGKWLNGSIFSDMPPQYNDEAVRLADLSNVCHLLCRYYSEIEKKPEILDFVVAYAERLILLQKDGGHIPAWVKFATGKSLRFCAKSAETSVHTIFLS